MGRGGVPARSYEAPPSHAQRVQKALHLFEARVRCPVPCRVTKKRVKHSPRPVPCRVTQKAQSKQAPPSPMPPDQYER